jgi:cupin fold WbuC family metalloprotein
MIRFVGAREIAALCDAARRSPRLRKNLNLHASTEEPLNRLLNALQPGTYVRPHRHVERSKAETLAILQGRLGLIEFDGSGGVIRTGVIAPGGAGLLVDLDPGTWHAAVALAPDTVVLEAKAGPYVPNTPEELAPWAPAEGDADAARYLAWMESLFAATTD